MVRSFFALAMVVVAVLAMFGVVSPMPVSAQVEPYNTTLAKQMLHLSGAAYCDRQNVLDWDCSFCKESDVAGLKPMGVAYNSTTNMLAYVSYDASRDSVMIVFRGTAILSILDWLEDLDFFAIPVLCPGCEIHEGFYKAYESIRIDFLNFVTAARKQHPQSDVIITGHSLGGALAYIAAVDLSITAGINVTHSYTFGAPRVGNRIFADTWAQIYQEDATFYRITHGLDPVPHVPPMLSGFQHPPTEVYYDGLNTGFKVCDESGEDPSCADQWLLPVGVTDHVTYLGIDFLAEFLKCAIIEDKKEVEPMVEPHAAAGVAQKKGQRQSIALA